ncbi:MAG: DNA-directed RNA polymerase subunit alpha, partial [Anaerolineae bacterium]|nr:DNA-directed RNA polymerase subunit alpha [Anaerolineae bacterium]
IEELELSVRAYNCLKRASIARVGEVLNMLEQGEDELLAIRNFGKKSLTELMEKLRDRGLVSPKQLETEGGGDAGTNPVA